MSDNSTTYNKILSRGIEANLPAIEDGKLRFTTDTGRLFLDVDNARVEITDFVKGNTEAQILSTLAPLPKLYLASDTKKIFYYDTAEEDWVSITADNVSHAATADSASDSIDSIERDGTTFTVTRKDGTQFTFEQQDNNTTYDVATNESAGLLPMLENDVTKYLKSDGSWDVPPNDNTTYDIANTTNAGLLPVLDADTTKYLNGNGQWTTPPNDNTTYDVASTASSGLLPTLDGDTTKYLNGNGQWTTPPNDNTTYDVASTASNGLLPVLDGSRDKYLRADGFWNVPPNDNTTYSADNGIGLNGNEFYNSGVRSIGINGNALNVNTNGTTADVTVPFATNASTATVASKDSEGNTISGTYAPLTSPTFDGTPTVPDVADGDNSTKVANTKFVNTAIASAISGITGIEYEVVEELPATGAAGTIYLVPIESATGSNLYTEYIWLTNRFEKLGTTELDLSNYVNNVQITGTGNAVTGFTKSGNTLTLEKNSTFLTQHPTISHNSTTAAVSPAAGSTIDVITNIVTDDNAHTTQFTKTEVTLPDSVSNSSTANYAKNAINSISRNGTDFTVTRFDGTTFAFDQQDNNTTYDVADTTKAGLLPTLDGSTTKYLRADGSWQVPPNDNTTYDVASTASSGLLPALNGSRDRYLRADGSWEVPPDNNTTYDVATTASNGLLPVLDGSTAKYLRADGSWMVPPSGTTYDIMSVAEGTAGTATTARTMTASNLKDILNAATFVNSYAPVEEADFDFGELTTQS